ncbi:MAG: long-chain fatty acid--CoA ligase [Bacteroidia bacterium]|nr:MAG: long-chain fatty acid--CoA ligase [Bacteroidia bacterium]
METVRLFDLLEYRKKKYPDKMIFAIKRKGQWVKVGIDEYIEKSKHFALGLLALGYGKGDNISVVTDNRPEWNFVDMGISMIGAIQTPIYAKISNEEYKHILTHSDSKMLIVASEENYKQIAPIVEKINNIREIYTFDELEGVKNWKEIVDIGKKEAPKYAKKLKEISDSITPNHIATIIYTSGTTGLAKGVMLSHLNLTANFTQDESVHPFREGQRIISFLPLCHVLGKVGNYMYQYNGVSVYYLNDLSQIGSTIREVQPHAFITVPRLLEKLYDRIIATGKDLPLPQKMVFFWAVRLGQRFDIQKKNSWLYNMKLKIADKLVFAKWREALGNNIVGIVSGGAALQSRIERVFWAANIKIQNGYGLTESAPMITANRYYPGGIKFGSVGSVVQNVEIKINDDGEILARGPNIMVGYYKEPELTKQAIDEDGWFHTGDVGEILEGKFLNITDRKKEMFKLSTGKYIAPQVIENKMKESLFIEQIMVLGEGEKFVAALISPNFTFIHDWCSRKKIKYRNNAKLVKKQQVIDRIGEEVKEFNKYFGHTEKIKKFRLVHEEWTPESGELSPTLKLKRRLIMKKYKKLINEIFAEK